MGDADDGKAPVFQSVKGKTIRLQMSSPLRLALVEERATAVAAADAAAEEAARLQRLGFDVAASRGPAGPPHLKRISQPVSSQWKRLETLHQVVQDSRAGETLRAGRPLLPRPALFPQTNLQTSDFTRPESLGARSLWDPKWFESPEPACRSDISGLLGTARSISTVTASRTSQPGWRPQAQESGWADPGSPLSAAGWVSGTLRQASCPALLLPSRSASQPSEQAADPFMTCGSWGSAATVPDLAFSSNLVRQISGPGVSDILDAPPLNRTALLRKCWSRSRGLIRSSREAIQDGPGVK